MKEFDKEEFLRDCYPFDKKWKESLLDRIEKLKDSDLEAAKFLIYYRDHCFRGEQDNKSFKKLEKEIGEEELRKRTIASLREVADLLEKTHDCYPGIYYCDLPKSPLLKIDFIDRISVTLSYPWPG